jgi:hypothetical protein
MNNMSNHNQKRVEFPQAQFCLLFDIIITNANEPIKKCIPVSSAAEIEYAMRIFFSGNYKDLFKEGFETEAAISVIFAGLSFTDMAVAEGKIWANLTDKQTGSLELSQYSPHLLDAQARLDKIAAILENKA